MKKDIREPQQERSIDKKNSIIKAGLKVFGEKGFYKTTTVEIAKIAGVSTGIVYNYFKDKKDILIHSLRLYFDNIFKPVYEMLAKPEKITDIESTARKFILMTINSHQNNFTSHEEMIAMSHLDEDVHDLFMGVEIETTKIIMEYLIKCGINPPHLKEKTHMIYNLIETLCHEYVYHRHVGIDYEEMIEVTVKMIVALFN